MLPLAVICDEVDDQNGEDVLNDGGVLCGNRDKLRGILVASAKEAAFRKVDQVSQFP